MPDQPNGLDNGFDIIFRYNERHYYVQVKYLRKSKVGLHSIKGFIDGVKGMKGHFWFIYNGDVTPLVQMEIEEAKRLNLKGRQVEFIQLAFPEMLHEKLPQLLKEYK